MQVVPDWTRTGIPSALERDIGCWEYKGPGLYLSNTDTMVAVYADNQQGADPWVRRLDDGNCRVTVYVFNVPLECTVLGSTIPTRFDDR